ncbi:DUF1320 domain-containing protein [Salmonella enterica]|nr:DUF1320 domain-containing protein [Salmonella enterica]EFP4633799.1 DUF1320 domain-containing protein [Salmonella enterica]EFS0362259.1 DUF1320 domain-containing protein [Salmonella enterica]EGK1504569.1 DUF1320 domain-containing protein [Salmonella enterica]
MYCTQDDLISAFSEEEIRQLSDRNRPASGAIDPVVVTNAINDATAEINMYLEGRGLLPLKTVPDTLRRISCDIARYYLYQNPRDDTPVTLRYRQRVKQLESVATGKLSLGLDETGNVPAPEETIQFTTGSNMFRQNGGGLW